MTDEQLNAHIRLSEEAPHRLRRADDRERWAMRLRLWEWWINHSWEESPFDTVQQLLDEHERELAAWAIKRGLGGTKP